MAKQPGSIWIDGNDFRYVDDTGREWKWTGVPVAPFSGQGGSFWMEVDLLRYINQAGNYVYQVQGPVVAARPGSLPGSIWINGNYFRWIDTSSIEHYAHADVTHSDGAGGHIDVPHTDTGHGDTHTDGTHGDAHTDVPHQDFHGDGHTDIAHSDGSHGDTGGYNYHGDNGSNHSDTHFDCYHFPPYPPAHTDFSDPGNPSIFHCDSHGDQAHQDSAHGDSAHNDDHNDQAHQDSPASSSHTDSSHGDSHSDAPPISTPHQDHTDSASVGHQDNPTLIGP